MAETGGLPAVGARVLGFICLTEAILVGLLTLGVVGLLVGLLLLEFAFGSPPLLTWFLLEVAVFLVGLVACFALHRAGKWLTAKATSAGGPSAIAVPDTLGGIGLAVEFVVAVWRFWQFLNRASWLQGPRVTKACLFIASAVCFGGAAAAYWIQDGPPSTVMVAISAGLAVQGVIMGTYAILALRGYEPGRVPGVR